MIEIAPLEAIAETDGPDRASSSTHAAPPHTDLTGTE
jgi:hypothetical protein